MSRNVCIYPNHIHSSLCPPTSECSHSYKFSNVITTSRNYFEIPKIARDTIGGIRSPPQYTISPTHSRKSSKDFSMNSIHE